ncbi:hypothetical protein GWK47_002003 [Chionoecetes opilio]|uniref:Uncharacterized protein n=1 Tax=Chionoecetes opilio TaxID=41210 RepID=A0A8J4XVX8_CHIOP|nr:hypothetical protein GWK47_002003 [Chionoecetes opilio]
MIPAGQWTDGKAWHSRHKQRQEHELTRLMITFCRGEAGNTPPPSPSVPSSHSSLAGTTLTQIMRNTHSAHHTSSTHVAKDTPGQQTPDKIHSLQSVPGKPLIK